MRLACLGFAPALPLSSEVCVCLCACLKCVWTALLLGTGLFLSFVCVLQGYVGLSVCVKCKIFFDWDLFICFLGFVSLGGFKSFNPQVEHLS